MAVVFEFESSRHLHLLKAAPPPVACRATTWVFLLTFSTTQQPAANACGCAAQRHCGQS